MHYSNDQVWIDANEYYKEIHKQFPKAYYILNTRDTPAWVRSRENHRKGKFIKRAERYYNLPRNEILELWTEQKETTEKEMVEYFADTPRFLTFHITNDDIDKVIQHVSPHYKLKRECWKVANKTKPNVKA